MNYFNGDWLGDCCILHEYLKTTNLYIGNDRSGRRFFDRDPTISNKLPISCKYGNTWRCMIGTRKRTYDPVSRGYLTKAKEEQPELNNIFKEFSNIHFPHIKWTDITINYMPVGSSIKIHTDGSNTDGNSVLVAFGDYEGGYTFVENKNDKNYTPYDARLEPVIFNGCKRKHFVSKVMKSDRYSIVFYKSKTKF